MNLKALGALSLVVLVTLFSPAIYAQTFSVIHPFNDQNGQLPISGITARAGVLYGTTECTHYPDNCGAGTVYQIRHVGSSWNYTSVSFFSAGGSRPQARVVLGPDGLLYGTTTNGGAHDAGIVFNLTPPASICRTAACLLWTEKVLYQFQGSPDGAWPLRGDLVWDRMGNIYGTTRFGGISDSGTVFQMTKSGNNWTEATLHRFTGSDGALPTDGVILDSNGNLFGTTTQGGSHSRGNVFELTYVNGIGWTETVLYNFQNLSDGQLPFAGLTKDSSGNLYGATSDGGMGHGGTVFELSPVGDTWVFTTLYNFAGDPGCGPLIALTMATSGELYGNTYCGGSYGLGSVFKLTNTQNGWEYTLLHDFTGAEDGSYPLGIVTIGTDGTLYGTASLGGNGSCNPPTGCGTVWMIEP